MRDLRDVLGIRVPVLQAPMAGGPVGPELVAAVSRAGGLGMFGVMGMTCDAVREDVRRALELGATAVAVNIQIARPAPGAGRPEDISAVLAPFHDELGIGGDAAAPKGDNPLRLVEAALEAGATVVSAALGDPAALAPIAQAAGAPLVAMVSTAEEARRSVEAGADVIVAQGMEAGGHRTTFDVSGELPLVGTLALVPRVVDAVDVPVVAAGGIMDGRGLAAALALGAQGAMLGTRFLLAEEARMPDAYREALLAAAESDTFVTDAITGRPARWIRNRVTQALADGPLHLGWGAQRGAVEPLRQAAAGAGRADLLPMLAGQGAGLTGAVQPAEEIVAEVVAQAKAVLARLDGAVE
jgi:nitronate monooxygenase